MQTVGERESLRIALAVLVLLTAPVGAAKQKIAVLEFEVTRGLDLDRTYFSDKVRGSVQDRAPQLFVMTRESTEVLLQQFGKTLADCLGECEVETGRKLGADYVVSGRITEVGSRLALTMRLHATATGELLKTAEVLARGPDALVDAVEGSVATLLVPLAVEGPEPRVQAPRPVVPEPAHAQNVRKVPDLREQADRTIEPKSGLVFVSVPAGAFFFQGERKIEVKAFRLGETAVTVAAYKRCFDAGECGPASGTDGVCNWGTNRIDHPINCVNWNQAIAFCKWVGGRLPTEEEREYVASGGSDGRTFPWGSEKPGAQACWWSDVNQAAPSTTCPVGSHPEGDSKWGLHDLAGNVFEWTNSAFDNRSTVIRGGSWNTLPDQWHLLRSESRFNSSPNARFDSLGFRCAL